MANTPIYTSHTRLTLNQMIGTKTFPGFGIFDHIISKSFHMPRCP